MVALFLVLGCNDDPGPDSGAVDDVEVRWFSSDGLARSGFLIGNGDRRPFSTRSIEQDEDLVSDCQGAVEDCGRHQLVAGRFSGVAGRSRVAAAGFPVDTAQ